MLGLTNPPSLAQGVDCARAQAAIGAAKAGPGGNNDGGQEEYTRAEQRQRYEIARTRDYATSIGCDNQGGFFDDPAPAECGAIAARTARMQENLAQIEERRQQTMQDDRRRAGLLDQFNASCARSGNPADLVQDQGPYLNGDGSQNPAGLRIIPVDPDQLSTVPLDGDISEPDAAPVRHAVKAICVRSCDGGYFPLSPRVSGDDLGNLEDLCKASCPNTEAHVYALPEDGNLASATTPDGTPYTALDAAFKFEKSFDASCTCKPPGQSWVEALADAEKLIGSEGKGDVTVTAKMSEDMAKPLAKPAPKSRSAKRAERTASAAAPDPAVASEALRGAQVPTASNDSAGIGPVPGQAASVLRGGDGPTKDVRGPDGIRRTIRVIVP